MAAGAAYRLAFPGRTDYAGHFLAGFGGTLLLLAVPVAWLRRVVRWEAIVLMFLAVGLGSILEATIFRLAIFDPVDFFNQSLGAALAAACVTGRTGSVPLATGLAALGVLALGAGFKLAFA